MGNKQSSEKPTKPSKGKEAQQDAHKGVIRREPKEMKVASDADYELALETHVQFDSESFNKDVPDFLGMVTVDAPAYEPTNRAAVDIVAVLDKSGSMSGGKISLVRKAMRRLVRNLGERDRVAFIAFDTQVETCMEFRTMNKEGRDAAKKIIGNLHEGSATNLCGGLTEAIKMLQKQDASEQNEVQAILLFTDGQANSGAATTKEGILAEARKTLGRRRNAEKWDTQTVCGWLQEVGLGVYTEQFTTNGVDGHMLMNDVNPEILEKDLGVKTLHAKKFEREINKLRGPQVEGNATTAPETQNPFQLHTFGFGSGHNVDLLQSLANEFDGMYFFMEDEKAIIGGFANVLGGLLSVTARDLVLKFIPNPKVKDFRVKKSDVVKNKDGSFTTRFSDLQAEESRHIVVQCKLPKIKGAEPQYPFFTCELHYRNLVREVDGTVKKACTINRSGSRGNMDVEVDVENNRVVSTEAMEIAEQLGEKSDFKSARLIVNEAISSIQVSPSAQEDWCQHAVSDLRNVLDGLSDRNTFQRKGKQYVAQNIMCYNNERAANFVEDEYACQSAWNTNTKEEMYTEFQRADSCDSACFDEAMMMDNNNNYQHFQNIERSYGSDNDSDDNILLNNTGQNQNIVQHRYSLSLSDEAYQPNQKQIPQGPNLLQQIGTPNVNNKPLFNIQIGQHQQVQTEVKQQNNA